MKKLLSTLLLTICLSGCVTTAAVLTCAAGAVVGEETGDCHIDDAMWVDGKILEGIGVIDPDADPAWRGLVSVEGVVTSGGTPVQQARTELFRGGELMLTAVTDASGRYELGATVHCDDLRVTIRHPDQRTTDVLPVECGEQTLDYDFALEESVYEFLGPVGIGDRVSYQGVVTAEGDPVVGARVELVGAWGTYLVSTDSEGNYEIPPIRVYPGECDGLTVIITHPDKRPSHTITVECGDQRLDYDFPRG